MAAFSRRASPFFLQCLRQVTSNGIRNALNTTLVGEPMSLQSTILKNTAPCFGSVLSRGFAANSVTVLTPEYSPTAIARKNPTSQISYDESNHERFDPGEPSKRAFTYLVLTGGRFIYASAIRLAVLKFIISMSASKDVLALSSLEVDVSAIGEGQTVTVKWRGKPVFIRHRTEREITTAKVLLR